MSCTMSTFAVEKAGDEPTAILHVYVKLNFGDVG